MWRTGVFAARRGDVGRHQLAFELEVHPARGGDYTTSALGMLSEAEEQQLQPGVEVDVRVDPAHSRSVAVVGPLMPSPG